MKFSPLSLFTALGLILPLYAGCSNSADISTATNTNETLYWGDAPNTRPVCIKGIHLTAWYTGSKKARTYFEPLLSETELNTVVIDLKEITGDVFIKTKNLDGEFNPYVNAIPDLRSYVSFLKSKGIYTIARIVVFKDAKLPLYKPEWAVKSSSPLPKAIELGYQEDVWVDDRGKTWVDPYNPWVWDYVLDIARGAVDAGFQEIQFDYIRFPSDGNTELCVYSKPHSSKEAARILGVFLNRAKERLKPLGVDISIDVFGLAGSVNNDLGIGQKLSELLDDIDIVSPMMYPSHYQNGVYGLKSPNESPYETIYIGTRDTLKLIGNKNVQFRPWIQDFSLGVAYTPQMVRAQITALEDQGIYEWLLWNPQCRYTKEALKPLYKPDFELQ